MTEHVTNEGAMQPLSSAWRRQRLSVDERIARGRAARQVAPRSSHADFAPADDRPDPLALLEEQEATSVSELFLVRHGRMSISSFTFYRAAALIVASDLASSPRSGITVQTCGDAHLSNFGLFGTPERRMIFDINDFDETLPGPWEWDVKRLAVSMLIAARANELSGDDQDRVLLDPVRDYRGRMRKPDSVRIAE